MIAPCLNCKERHTACWSSCDRYKARRAEFDAVKEAELAFKARDSSIKAVKQRGMKRDGKRMYER